MSTYELTDVAAPAAQTVEAVSEEIRSRAITEYAVVDHGHDMAAAGVTPHPAWTLVFGNPAAGEAVLEGDLAAAVDIPLRLAVIGRGEDQSQIVMRPVESLLEPELSTVAEHLTMVLRAVAAGAKARAEQPPA